MSNHKENTGQHLPRAERGRPWSSQGLCVSHFSLMQDFLAVLPQTAWGAEEIPSSSQMTLCQLSCRVFFIFFNWFYLGYCNRESTPDPDFRVSLEGWSCLRLLYAGADELQVGWQLGLFLFKAFFIRDDRPLTNSPQILMLSVPNYLFHRYLLWLSPMGNHETDVLEWPHAS